MVTLANHGGSCCGAKHIFGFGPAENTDPSLIDRQLSSVINGQSTEVILNGTQVRNLPNVLARLAALGFVLDGHWNNGNHGNPGSDNYRFCRADRRRPLLQGPIAGLWNGMVMSPGLEGNLTPMHGTRAQNGNATRYTRPLPAGWNLVNYRNGVQPFVLGDIVRVTNTRSTRHGRMFRVNTINSWDRKVYLSEPNGIFFELVYGSVELVTPFVDPAAYREGECVPGARILQKHSVSNMTRGRAGTIILQARTSQYPEEAVYTIKFDTDDPNGVDLHQFRKNFIVLNEQDTFPRIAPEVPQPVPNERHFINAEFETVQQPPVPAVAVLFQTYHNVYRDGRVGAGYQTYQEAADARRGNGRIDRKDMMSDGTTNIVENVEN